MDYHHPAEIELPAGCESDGPNDPEVLLDQLRDASDLAVFHANKPGVVGAGAVAQEEDMAPVGSPGEQPVVVRAGDQRYHAAS